MGERGGEGEAQGRFSWSGWVGSADRICAPNGNVHIYLSCFDFALIFQLFFLFLFFVYFIFQCVCVCACVVVAKRYFQMVCQEKTERAGQIGIGSRRRKQAEAEPEAGTDTARSLAATEDTHTDTDTHTLVHTHRKGDTHRRVHTHTGRHTP